MRSFRHCWVRQGKTEQGSKSLRWLLAEQGNVPECFIEKARREANPLARLAGMYIRRGYWLRARLTVMAARGWEINRACSVWLVPRDRLGGMYGLPCSATFLRMQMQRYLGM
jgi:hypothetical protein